MLVARVAIGIGNEFRQDDGVGIAVARQVRASAPAGVTVLERSGEGTDLIASWEDAGLVVVIDAVRSGAPAGTIHRFSVAGRGDGIADSTREDRCLPPVGIFRGTSHQIGLGEGIELARLMGRLPAMLVIYGIEGTAFGEGTSLTEPVARAVSVVTDRVLDELRQT